MRFVFLLIFLIAGFLSAQNVPEEYYDAMEDFHRENYMAAFKAFMFNLGGGLKHSQIDPNKEAMSLKMMFCMCIRSYCV